MPKAICDLCAVVFDTQCGRLRRPSGQAWPLSTGIQTMANTNIERATQELTQLFDKAKHGVFNLEVLGV